MIAGEGPRHRGRQAGHRAVSRAADGPAAPPLDLSADRASALVLTPVSRETLNRLDRFVDLLLTWQQRINLIAPSTAAHVWTRHIVGSGGGFPGLVIACALAETPGAQVHLVEANAKKAAFLREAARVTGAPVSVHNGRIEDFLKNPPTVVDVVTARALAPLSELLGYAHPLLKRGARAVFPKGQDVDAELTEAAKYWKIQLSLALSRTDPKARIVVVRGLEPKSRPASDD